jgi:hypothetical protein
MMDDLRQELYKTVANWIAGRLQTSVPIASGDAVPLGFLQDAIAGIDIDVPAATAATATAAGQAGIVALAAGNDTTSWGVAATPAGVAAQVAAKISGGVTGAPLPTASATIGQWLWQYSSSSSIALPAGGTWAWLLGGSISGWDNVFLFSSSTAGVSAGGTTLSAGSRSVGLLAWRIS